MNGGQIKLHEILADECHVLDQMQKAGGITERIRSLETEGRKDEARCRRLWSGFPGVKIRSYMTRQACRP